VTHYEETNYVTNEIEMEMEIYALQEE